MGEVLGPQSQDRTPVPRYSPNSLLATSYRESGLVPRPFSATQPSCGERLFLPLSGRSLTPPGFGLETMENRPSVPIRLFPRPRPKPLSRVGGGHYNMVFRATKQSHHAVPPTVSNTQALMGGFPLIKTSAAPGLFCFIVSYRGALNQVELHSRRGDGAGPRGTGSGM